MLRRCRLRACVVWKKEDFNTSNVVKCNYTVMHAPSNMCCFGALVCIFVLSERTSFACDHGCDPNLTSNCAACHRAWSVGWLANTVAAPTGSVSSLPPKMVQLVRPRERGVQILRPPNSTRVLRASTPTSWAKRVPIGVSGFGLAEILVPTGVRRRKP